MQFAKCDRTTSLRPSSSKTSTDSSSRTPPKAKAKKAITPDAFAPSVMPLAKVYGVANANEAVRRRNKIGNEMSNKMGNGNGRRSYAAEVPQVRLSIASAQKPTETTSNNRTRGAFKCHLHHKYHWLRKCRLLLLPLLRKCLCRRKHLHLWCKRHRMEYIRLACRTRAGRRPLWPRGFQIIPIDLEKPMKDTDN
jgi:hypothetical protein